MFLNLVTTNPGEVKELLGNLLPAVVGVFVVYLPLLVLAIVNISKKGMIVVQLQHRVRRWALEIAAVGLFCLLACYVAVDDYRLRNQLYPVNVCYNLYLAFERDAASENYREASRNFRFDARSEHDAEAPEVYVMVVGETARAHNFSLYGYPRDTNPLLSKTPGIIAFPMLQPRVILRIRVFLCSCRLHQQRISNVSFMRKVSWLLSGRRDFIPYLSAISCLIILLLISLANRLMNITS